MCSAIIFSTIQIKINNPKMLMNLQLPPKDAILSAQRWPRVVGFLISLASSEIRWFWFIFARNLFGNWKFFIGNITRKVLHKYIFLQNYMVELTDFCELDRKAELIAETNYSDYTCNDGTIQESLHPSSVLYST